MTYRYNISRPQAYPETQRARASSARHVQSECMPRVPCVRVDIIYVHGARRLAHTQENHRKKNGRGSPPPLPPRARHCQSISHLAGTYTHRQNGIVQVQSSAPRVSLSMHIHSFPLPTIVYIRERILYTATRSHA